MMVKLTDFLAEFLSKKKLSHVFGVTGGSVVHIFDSLEKYSIIPIFTHHEQAASFAATAFSRITENIGCCIVTTGPGCTNAITGLCSAWLDSIPVIFISGQTRYEHTNHKKPFRQFGSQQIDIVSVVKSITKYAVMLEDPNKIKYELQKAFYLAKNGRPGPVWIDIPLDFQWTNIDTSKLLEFNESEFNENKFNGFIDKDVEKSCKWLSESKRPVIIAGYGIRLAKAVKEFRQFVAKFKIPFVSTWNSSDMLPTDHPNYCGRLGISGNRGANLAVQNSDLIISIGSHFSIPLTSSNFSNFGRSAKKILIDIDEIELDCKTVPIDLSIKCDAKIFLKKITQKYSTYSENNINFWRSFCSKYKSYNKYSTKYQKEKKYVDPYFFIEYLSANFSKSDTVVVDGGGTALYISNQAVELKENQRLIVSAGIGAMGSGLPESIGACFANKKKRTICMVGDGSLQFNIQEFQTIVHHKLPIKIIVFNNEGYLAIRYTQKEFLSERYVGSNDKGGISLPDFIKVANSYGIRSVRIYNNEEIKEKMENNFHLEEPCLIEIMVSPNQNLIPNMGFVKNEEGKFTAMPLEDMRPFLERKEFLKNMLIKPLHQSRSFS